MHNDDRTNRHNRHEEPLRQPAVTDLSLRDAKGLTDGAFTHLNRRPATAWEVPAEVADACREALKGRAPTMGASSSVMEHETRTKIPLEGGPDSQRAGAATPNRHA